MHAASYENVRVKFLGGHSPIFYEYEGGPDGAELSRTDLSRMNLDEMHSMLKSKGFRRKGHYKDEL